MIHHSYSLHGFILKRRNQAEADKVLTVFSKEQGKVTLIAKGIRRITSRRAGSLELFNEVELQVVKGKGWDIVTETQLLHSHTNFSQDFNKTQIAYQLVELVDKLMMEEEAHIELYDLLQMAFNYIEDKEITKERVDAVLLRFKLRILDLLGFGTPAVATLEGLKEYIENIIEKRLVAGKHFEV